jgi:hypothetical protein
MQEKTIAKPADWWDRISSEIEAVLDQHGIYDATMRLSAGWLDITTARDREGRELIGG